MTQSQADEAKALELSDSRLFNELARWPREWRTRLDTLRRRCERELQPALTQPLDVPPATLLQLGSPVRGLYPTSEPCPDERDAATAVRAAAAEAVGDRKKS